MARTAAELKAQRAVTSAFIAADSTSVTLIPRSPQRSGSGTQYVDGTARDPQVVKLVDQSSTSGPQPGLLRALDGVQRQVTFQMVMEHDAVLGLHDYWIDEAGIRCEVAEILPDNGYERRAQVIRYGE